MDYSTAINKKKKVALVLSSGGARGYAHIGAIRELEEQGYEISSVAGCSMGALIGGIYCAGKLPEVTKLLCSLTMREIFSVMDFSLSLNHLVKGQKVIQMLKDVAPDVDIKDLKIPFVAVASDVKNHQEVTFTEGSLYDAIRASISIPSFFKPVRQKGRVLVDGGLLNPLPLDLVKRQEGDLLVAVNVSAASKREIEEMRAQAEVLYRKESPILSRFLPQNMNVENNYVSLISETFSMSIERNAELMIKLIPPDVLVNIPSNRFGGFDYDRAEKIIQFGRWQMRQALARLENPSLAPTSLVPMAHRENQTP